MSERNKAVARRLFEAWNSGELDTYDELIAPDAVTHDSQDPFTDVPGPEGMKRLTRMYRGGFPDTHFMVNAQIADDDLVCTRWTATGRNDGELMGMPPSGKSVVIAGVSITRHVDGKITESWVSWDTLGMLQQLGVIPATQPAHA
jgi:steroid delta-isomerase-like uncharacterized protein